MPYNERIVTDEDRDDALNGAAAELCRTHTAGLATDLRRLDDASSLVEVLQRLLDCSRARARQVSLSMVKGSELRPWRTPPGAVVDAAAGERFPLSVGGRVVAVLDADPAHQSSAADLDILTRYASRLLESMTLHKALGLVPPKMGSGVI